MHSHQENCAPSDIARRGVLKASAWTVPVVSVAIAAPAAAASVTTAPGSIYVQQISLFGGGGQPAQGNFVVQAVKGVDGDTRTVVLSPVATLYRLVNGTRELVGTLTLSPSASAPKLLDGGSQQFTFNDSSLPLVQGTTYVVSVVATGIVSDGALYTATLESSQHTAW